MIKNKWKQVLLKRCLPVIMSLLVFFGCLPAAVHAQEGPEYQFGLADIYSSATYTVLYDSFYFNDNWFFEDPVERNDALALASMQLTAACSPGIENSSGQKLLEKLGFETGFSNKDGQKIHSSGYVWGRKKITNGDESCTLVAINIVDYGPGQKNGWISNFIINGDGEGETAGEHYGFSKSAEGIADKIVALGGSDNVRFWISGHSRGGAVTNILSTLLPEKLGDRNKGIFAYTFESPTTVDENAESFLDNDAKYPWIHNYFSTDDIITMIPFWDMTTYGRDYLVNTNKANVTLAAELKKLGSFLADQISDENMEEVAKDMVRGLKSKIPYRADYSAMHTETFTNIAGKKVTVSYSFQDTITNAIAIGFDQGIEGIVPMSRLVRLIGKPDLITAINTLAEAVMNDSGEKYYQAAERLHKLLLSLNKDLPFSVTDFYVILKLVGSQLIDATYYPVTIDNLFDAFSPALKIYGEKDALIFSHHYETSIARLKGLAPAPDLSPLDLAIPAPAAGDACEKAEKEVAQNAERLDSAGAAYLTAKAKWDSKEATLSDNTVHTLSVTFQSIGHSIPGDLSITINGQAPAEDLTVTHRKGKDIITGAWIFPVGSPEQITVTYDTAGRGETPEPVSVFKGTRLKYTKPAVLNDVTDKEGTWKFYGWADKNGVPWEELNADQELTVYAVWKYQIEDAAVKVTLPKLGERLKEISVLRPAVCEISDAHMWDRTYEDVTSAESAGIYEIEFAIRPKNSADAEFATVWDEEYEDYEYTGKIAVNGINIPANGYYPGGDTGISWRYEEGRIIVTERFVVSRKAQPMKVTGKASSFSFLQKVLKKSGKSVKASAYVKVTKNQGKLTYTKTKGSKQIAVNKKTGTITVRKGTKKGNYPIRIKIRASGNASYKAGSKTIRLTMKVK